MTWTLATCWAHRVTPVTAGGGICSDIAVSNSTPAISTSIIRPGRTGAQSLQTKCVAGVGEAYLGHSLGSGQTAVAAGWFCVNTLPSTQYALVCNFFDSAFGTTVAIRVSSAGQLSAIVGAGTPQTGPTVSAGQWFYLAVKFDSPVTTWTLDWTVDGTARTQATEGGHSSNTSTKHFYVRSGSGVMTGTCDIYTMDLVAGVTSGDYPGNSLYEVRAVGPSGAADHQSITTTEVQYSDDLSAWNNLTGNTEADSASRIAVPFVLTKGIRMNAAALAGNLRWNLSDLADFAPIIVKSLIAVREETTGTNNAVVRIRSAGGTTADIFASANPGWGTTINYLALMSANVPGGSGWTLADVNGLTLEADSTDADPDVWLIAMMSEVLGLPTGARSRSLMGAGV